MNGLERAWSRRLDAAGQHWHFDSVKLRLADRTFYTPDFLVLCADLTLQFHEVKGHWEDDARVKVKVAAEQYPEFQFLAVQRTPQRQGGVWSFELFKSSRQVPGGTIEESAKWARERLRTLLRLDLSDADFVKTNIEAVMQALDPKANPKIGYSK